MSFSSTTARAQYTGNGSTREFAVTFPFQTNADLAVVLTSAAGVDTTQVLNTDYIVSGAGQESGGTVRLTTAPASGVKVTVFRDLDLNQERSFTYNGAFPTATVTGAADKAMQAAQQLNEKLKRTFRIAETNAEIAPLAVAQRAGKVAGFDSTGAPTLYEPEIAVLPNGAAYDVATIAALMAIPVSSIPESKQIVVGGYYAAGDGGGGVFLYNSASSATDNGGTVIAPVVGNGRWIRAYDGAVNVRWFGAKGDQTTDDTTEIQAAINYAVSENKAIYFPKSIGSDGLYLVTAPITVTGKTRIYGDGKNISGIFCSNTDGFIISAGVSFFTLENIAIYNTIRTANTKTALKISGTSLSRCDHITIKDIYIDGFNIGIQCDWMSQSRLSGVMCNYVFNGIVFTGSGLNLWVDSCWWVGQAAAATRGIYINGSGAAPEAINFQKCLTFGFETAVHIIGCTHSSITDCIFDYSTKYGIILGAASFNYSIENNYIASSGASGDVGIHLSNSSASSQIKGNTIRGNLITAYGSNAFTFGVMVDGAEEKQNRIIGNTVNCNATYDCRINAGLNHVVSGNVWMGSGGFYVGSASIFPIYESNSGAMTTGVQSIRQTRGITNIYFGESPPASGTYLRDDIVYNISVNAAEYIGWVCVGAGSPGSWKGFGLIEA